MAKSTTFTFGHFNLFDLMFCVVPVTENVIFYMIARATMENDTELIGSFQVLIFSVNEVRYRKS